MSTTTTSQADIAADIVRETAGKLGIATSGSGYSQPVRDAWDDYVHGVDYVLGVGGQLAADLEELDAKRDLVPAHGYDRLRGEAVADATSRTAEALRRSEAAEGRLVEALTDDALPTFAPERESLVRQELTLALDGADGKSVLTRVLWIAQDGSPEAVACLLRTPFGKTLLASRGASGREIAEAMTTARKVAAIRAAEHGQTERQRKAGKALGSIGTLSAARTAARGYVSQLVG
jgi:hypothetical protein